jgi:hypothetical protein
MDELTKVILAVVVFLASLAALLALICSLTDSFWEALDRFNHYGVKPGSPEADEDTAEIDLGLSDTDEWENNPRKG